MRNDNRSLTINGRAESIPDAWRRASLLVFLRDHLGLTGTKYGCGAGLCGACTVHVDGQAARACVMPVEGLADRSITTIERLASEQALHPVQRAWVELSVPQCGYCQPGQIMTAASFLAANANPSEDEVNRAMSGNLCRCGTYERIRRAVLRAAALRGEAS